MPILFAIGRVLFVLIFILSGAQKLMDIAGTAALISPKVVVPPALADIVGQVESMLGLPLPQILVIIVGGVELASGLLIAFNVGTRVGSLLLIAFILVAAFYFHDFWSMGSEAKIEYAMKNLSVIGALIILFVLGSWRPVTVHADDVDRAGVARY